MRQDQLTSGGSALQHPKLSRHLDIPLGADALILVHMGRFGGFGGFVGAVSLAFLGRAVADLYFVDCSSFCFSLLGLA